MLSGMVIPDARVSDGDGSIDAVSMAVSLNNVDDNLNQHAANAFAILRLGS